MKFVLKAIDPGRRVVAVEIDATDEAAAQDLARERGLSILALRRGTFFGLPNLRLARPFPTRLFSIELLALLEAGLNIVEALQTLAEKEPVGAHRKVLVTLLEAIARGEPFSQAIARFPEFFSSLYIATIRSSERTGNVKDALVRFIAYQESVDIVRRKALSALLYPAILLVAGVLVLGFLMFYVVPRFARVYEDISTSLPAFSSLLLSLGRSVDAHGGTIAAVLATVFCAGAWTLSQQQWRARLIAQLWRLPWLGERMKIYQLARFYRTVSMLLRAGIAAPRAIEMVATLLAPSLRTHLWGALTAIREGRTISSSLTAAGLATPVATRMMMVGERSGQMADLMDRVARFYDEQTARFVDAFTRLLEPALMAAIGLAVGLVVVLMYMPIFELARAIQ